MLDIPAPGRASGVRVASPGPKLWWAVLGHSRVNGLLEFPNSGENPADVVQRSRLGVQKVAVGKSQEKLFTRDQSFQALRKQKRSQGQGPWLRVQLEGHARASRDDPHRASNGL